MTRYLGYCALALLTVLPTASVYSAVQNDTMGLYAPDPSYTPDIQNSAPVTPSPGMTVCTVMTYPIHLPLQKAPLPP